MSGKQENSWTGATQIPVIGARKKGEKPGKKTEHAPV